MSWSENTKSRCNNESCGKEIFWNELIRHPQTKRMRPLDEPYFPDASKHAKLHLCMRTTPPKTFINKYQKYYKGGYTPEQVLAMRNPKDVAEWERQKQEWLEKWK